MKVWLGKMALAIIKNRDTYAAVIFMLFGILKHYGVNLSLDQQNEIGSYLFGILSIMYLAWQRRNHYIVHTENTFVPPASASKVTVITNTLAKGD